MSTRLSGHFVHAVANARAQLDVGSILSGNFFEEFAKSALLFERRPSDPPDDASPPGRSKVRAAPRRLSTLAFADLRMTRCHSFL
jgi:hypothetical protein